MDPLTHSVFGVACAIAGTRQKVSRRAAALAGLAGGLLPDADVLLRSASDPLFTLEYHRHFTHSFAFAPVIALMGAIIASLILRAFRHTVPWQWLIFPALLGGLSHIFCDRTTSFRCHDSG
jgi:inner membrane protein